MSEQESDICAVLADGGTIKAIGGTVYGAPAEGGLTKPITNTTDLHDILADLNRRLTVCKIERIDAGGSPTWAAVPK